MMIKTIEGVTRVIGKAQGYLGLPVRDAIVHDKASGHDVPSMTTAWEPDPKELERLAAGASVHVQLLGQAHPPIIVSVGDAPEAGL